MKASAYGRDMLEGIPHVEGIEGFPPNCPYIREQDILSGKTLHTLKGSLLLFLRRGFRAALGRHHPSRRSAVPATHSEAAAA